MRYFKTESGWLRDTLSPVGVALEDSAADLSAHYGVTVEVVEVEDDADPRTEPFVPEPERAPQVVESAPVLTTDEIVALKRLAQTAIVEVPPLEAVSK